MFSLVWRPNRALAINFSFSVFASPTRPLKTANSTDSMRASNEL